MQEEKNTVDGPERDTGTVQSAPRDVSPRRHTNGRAAEPLLVELAWLVIEGAVLYRRVRGILARI